MIIHRHDLATYGQGHVLLLLATFFWLNRVVRMLRNFVQGVC